jgi:hypothetical protein
VILAYTPFPGTDPSARGIAFLAGLTGVVTATGVGVGVGVDVGVAPGLDFAMARLAAVAVSSGPGIGIVRAPITIAAIMIIAMNVTNGDVGWGSSGREFFPP